MARIDLKNEGMPRFMIDALNQKAPALPRLFEAVTLEAKINAGVDGARKAAGARLASEGLRDEKGRSTVFDAVKNTAVELSQTDNGEGNARGIAGITVMHYFAGRAAAEGLPENTGKAYARLTGQIVEALSRGLVDAETVQNWTRPDAQRFFASDDAAKRAEVVEKVRKMTNGATVEYCDQLAAHLATFQYQRPEDAQQGTAAWDGHAIRKPKATNGNASQPEAEQEAA